MKTQSDVIVVLSDERCVLETLRAALPAGAELHVADSFDGLLALAQAPHVRGVVVDAPCLGNRVLSKLTQLRDGSPLLRILFVASELPALLLNDLQPLRVELVARPLPLSALSLFVERVLTAGRLNNCHVAAYIDQLAHAHRLNGKEVELFSVVLDNETAEHACARLGFDAESFSRTMRRLLKKCHMRSSDRLAKSVMRDALLSTRSLTASMVEPFSRQQAF